MPVNKGGGNTSHRTDCGCFACTRQKEAVARAAGSVSAAVAADPIAEVANVELAAAGGPVINADILERPGRTPRHRVGEWLMWRHQDPTLTNTEIAKKLGISHNTLNGYIAKANKEGWLKFSDPISRLEHEITPMVLDNLAHYLSVAGGRDKQVTIETAKGMVFKQYLEAKGISEAPQTVLALKIETVAPEGSTTPVKIGSGHVVGTPRIQLAPGPIDATVVEG